MNLPVQNTARTNSAQENTRLMTGDDDAELTDLDREVVVWLLGKEHKEQSS